MSSSPLYKRIQEDIKAQIASGVLRAGDRIPSESEMRKHYFVSAMTVRSALNGLADEGIIYRVQGKGSFVAQSVFSAAQPESIKPAITLGVIFPTLSTRVEQLYLLYIERICREKNGRVLVGCSSESPEQEIRIMQKFMACDINALMLFPTVSEINNAVARQLVARRFPFVFMDRELPEVPAPHVVSDGHEGGRLAANWLMDRAGGDVAICHFPILNTAVSGRLEGFKRALVERGYAFSAQHQCLIDDSDMFLADTSIRLNRIYPAIQHHLKRYPNIRALFATNVEIAQIAHLVVKRMGFTPGLDFQIVGFDNPHKSGVHYIDQDYEQMIAEAFRLLEDQIAGAYAYERVVSPVRFVEVPPNPKTIEDMRHLVTGINP